VVKTMLLTKLKVATAVLLLAAVAVLGTGGLLYSRQAESPFGPTRESTPKAEPGQKPDEPDRLAQLLREVRELERNRF